MNRTACMRHDFRTMLDGPNKQLEYPPSQHISEQHPVPKYAGRLSNEVGGEDGIAAIYVNQRYCESEPGLLSSALKLQYIFRKCVTHLQSKHSSISLASKYRMALASYGRRLLVTILDETAKVTPDKPIASVPRTPDLTDGWRDISFREIAHAVDELAWWFHETVGASKNSETVIYMGINDIRYMVFILAAIKVGLKVCWTL